MAAVQDTGTAGWLPPLIDKAVGAGEGPLAGYVRRARDTGPGASPAHAIARLGGDYRIGVASSDAAAGMAAGANDAKWSGL